MEVRTLDLTSTSLFYSFITHLHYYGFYSHPEPPRPPRAPLVVLSLLAAYSMHIHRHRKLATVRIQGAVEGRLPAIKRRLTERRWLESF